MRVVQTWQDSELLDREIRSCDNKEVGHAKAGDSSFLASVRGVKSFRIPRESVAAFDGDKIYLRATEAEVLAGVYPFIAGEEECNCECHFERKDATSERAATRTPSTAPSPEATTKAI